MKFEMVVAVREQTGKGVARKLRRAGKLPAVLYGQDECLLLTVKPEDLLRILKSHVASTALLTLTVDGASKKSTRIALLRDYQSDPATGELLHADLFEVAMDKTIRIKVPVAVVGGMPAGVKEGGVLHHNLREVHVECLPSAIPDRLEVDASGLNIAQGIHIKELVPLAGVRILDDPDQMVVSVAIPMSEAKLEALLTSAAVGEEGKEPELIAKGKVVEGEEAVAAAAAAPAAGEKGAAPAEAKAGAKPAEAKGEKKEAKEEKKK